MSRVKRGGVSFCFKQKKSDSDGSHDLSNNHREEPNPNPFTRVEHCAVDTSGAPGGGVPGAWLDDGVATTRAACADECAVGRRIPPVHWSSRIAGGGRSDLAGYHTYSAISDRPGSRWL